MFKVLIFSLIYTFIILIVYLHCLQSWFYRFCTLSLLSRSLFLSLCLSLSLFELQHSYLYVAVLSNYYYVLQR